MAEPLHYSLMRIIGGSLKGRLIDPPDSFRARPTTDFARESLLNIISNRYDYENLSLLDLFAGTGAISYEFASRGCPDIDTVEIEKKHTDFIRKTTGNLNLEKVRVHRIDVRTWLKVCRREYSIIFADPPYDLPWLRSIPDMILRSAATGPSTLVIVEHPRKISFTEHPAFSEHRSYGNVNFTFFRP